MSAQSATLDSKKILASIPEIAKLDTIVIKENEKYLLDFGKKQVIAQQEFKIADSLFKLKPKDQVTIQAINKAKQSNKELEDFEIMARKKVDEFKSLLFKPYLEKINNAIKIVANKRKFMQVIDIHAVSFVYINPKSDITEEVIKELKTKM